MPCSPIQHVSNGYLSIILADSVALQKMDLGACPKSHTERLKTEYLAAKEANPNDLIFNRFQMEYESNIFTFVDECDRRIRSAHRRLEKTPEENAKTTNLVWFFSCVSSDLRERRLDARNCGN
jgi:hypothetical protein